MDEFEVTINIKTGNVFNYTVYNKFESTSFCKKTLDIPGNNAERSITIPEAPGPEEDPIELLLIVEKKGNYKDIKIKVNEGDETDFINPLILIGQAVIKNYSGNITFKNTNPEQNEHRIIEAITSARKTETSSPSLINKRKKE